MIQDFRRMITAQLQHPLQFDCIDEIRMSFRASPLEMWDAVSLIPSRLADNTWVPFRPDGQITGQDTLLHVWSRIAMSASRPYILPKERYS
jgi:hypothetical protein